jgi:hypothetical protein
MTLPAFRRVAQLGLVLAAGCVKQLPPAPTPEPIAPAVAAAAPPPSGQGRLVVDVVDGPTPIHRVLMQAEQAGAGRFRFLESPTPLCAASPCVADLPAGNVLLGFPVLGDAGALEVELVHVGPEATVYRRSLSRREGTRGALTVLGIIGTSLGAGAVITGGTLLPIGLDDDDDDLAAAGGITLAAGAIVMTIGIWMIRADSPTYRPGSAVHFTP